jgi:hypothetical protein
MRRGNPYTKKRAQHLTSEQIEAVVKDAILQGRIYDDAMNEALYGERVPTWWGEWTTEAKKAWDLGAELYLTLRPARDDKKQLATFTLAEVWRAMDKSAAMPAGDTRLTWRNIAHQLGIGTRDTTRLCSSLGFRMRGSSHAREIYKAPCIECGEVYVIDDLHWENHGCQNCQKKLRRVAS